MVRQGSGGIYGIPRDVSGPLTGDGAPVLSRLVQRAGGLLTAYGRTGAVDWTHGVACSASGPRHGAQLVSTKSLGEAQSRMTTCNRAPQIGQRGPRGRALQRRRSEYLERPNAHLYETGGLRRLHLRGHANILKRLLVHVGGFNLGLLMRTLCGVGTPRGLQGRLTALVTLIAALWAPPDDRRDDDTTLGNERGHVFTPHHRLEFVPVMVSTGPL